jgi:UDP-N-acetyl-D-glucosamine dehydrogenase
MDMQALLNKFKDRTARVAVIGAGYVGLPFAVECAASGIETVAIDLDPDKIRQINEGKSYIGDVSDADLAAVVGPGTLRGSTDTALLGEADGIVICVPTPLNKTKDPDVSMIMSAADAIAPRLRGGQLVVLESTTYPGFTREMLKPHLEATGHRVGEEIFLAFSPERVDPGNPVYQTKNTPKVVGGITEACTELTAALYGNFIDTIVQVSSTDAAEMVKLLENTFRAVNIGLVNEVALMCRKLDLDTWEVIDAAATKPFGFMPFYPGPGLGGHCIPVDPHYLSWKLKTLKYNARFIELAGVINSGMPEVTVQLVARALNARKKPVKGSRVLVLGVAYKRDIEDVRESPALDVIELLAEREAEISYHDPFVPSIRTGGRELQSVPLESVGDYDCVVIITDHSSFDYEQICKKGQLIVDTRHATREQRDKYGDKIVSL